VSCAGATVLNELMRLAYDRRQSFVVALDNDPAGERGWRKAWDETVDWGGFKISSACPKHRDWNDDLMSLQLAQRKAKHSLSNC
jgi:Toprim-like